MRLEDRGTGGDSFCILTGDEGDAGGDGCDSCHNDSGDHSRGDASGGDRTTGGGGSGCTGCTSAGTTGKPSRALTALGFFLGLDVFAALLLSFVWFRGSRLFSSRLGGVGTALRLIAEDGKREGLPWAHHRDECTSAADFSRGSGGGDDQLVWARAGERSTTGGDAQFASRNM